MNRPIIVNANAMLLYDEKLQEAKHYRQVQKFKAERPRRLAQLLARFGRQQPEVQAEARDAVAPA